ncbi:MAG TPA: type II toxin-antitoxin system death-on-curing family toxin [Roseiflexaceae bacterium]|jgi:death-on-curing protein|nr:type II toxin-antitoxin system death-on-curing family toxin [Roseiflexaceae bacterium]
MSESKRSFANRRAANSTNYLSKNDLLDLHTFVIERYGGRMGIASQDRLNTVLNAPRQVMFNAELYPDVPSKAAAQTFLLLKSRPFVNANQSTALMVLLRFLAINNVVVREHVSADELLWVIRTVDQSAFTKEQLEAWLRENTMPVSA